LRTSQCSIGRMTKSMLFSWTGNVVLNDANERLHSSRRMLQVLESKDVKEFVEHHMPRQPRHEKRLKVRWTCIRRRNFRCQRRSCDHPAFTAVVAVKDIAAETAIKEKKEKECQDAQGCVRARGQGVRRVAARAGIRRSTRFPQPLAGPCAQSSYRIDAAGQS